MEKRQYQRTELLTVDISGMKIRFMVHCEYANRVSRTDRSLAHVHLCLMSGRLRLHRDHGAGCGLNHSDEPSSAFHLPGRSRPTPTITCAPWTLKKCSKRPIRPYLNGNGVVQESRAERGFARRRKPPLLQLGRLARRQ
jgi:hypothetical protein